MANEATIQSSLQIRAGKIEYQSRPSSFRADVTGRKGPLPGAFTVTTEGTDADFSQLDTPSLCRMQNLDEDNYIQWGAWDPELGRFYPIGRLLPGESFTLRLDDDLGEEVDLTGTGTGTSGLTTNRLRFRANGADCIVLCEAFEK